MMTKASLIAETVDRLQTVADETGAPALWWHLGRLEVIGSLSALFGLAQVREALDEALDALAGVEAERASAAEPAKPSPMEEVRVQSWNDVEGWASAGHMRRYEAEAWVAGRVDRRIKP